MKNEETYDSIVSFDCASDLPMLNNERTDRVKVK